MLFKNAIIYTLPGLAGIEFYQNALNEALAAGKDNG